MPELVLVLALVKLELRGGGFPRRGGALNLDGRIVRGETQTSGGDGVAVA
jgi:hypothetical protein